MEEIIRPHRTSEGSGPNGLGDPLAPTGDTHAYVVSGPYAEQLPVGGMSVGEIRRRYGDRCITFIGPLVTVRVLERHEIQMQLIETSIEAAVNFVLRPSP